MQLVKPQPGDIIAVHGNGPVTLGIEIITDSPVCHIALAYDDTRCIEAQALRTVGYAPLAQYAGQSTVLRVTRATESQRQAALTYALSKFGDRYDYGAIFAEFERYEWHRKIGTERPDTFICSSLVVAAYMHAGITLVDPNVGIASPDDIYRSPETTTIGLLAS